MNTIDSNKPNISFGIAFRTYKAPSGNYTNELITVYEELALYKRLNRKLNRDKFIKTELGLETKKTKLVKDVYVADSKALRYITPNESFYIDDNRTNLHGVGDKFNRLRQKFIKMLSTD